MLPTLPSSLAGSPQPVSAPRCRSSLQRSRRHPRDPRSPLLLSRARLSPADLRRAPHTARRPRCPAQPCPRCRPRPDRHGARWGNPARVSLVISQCRQATIRCCGLCALCRFRSLSSHRCSASMTGHGRKGGATAPSSATSNGTEPSGYPLGGILPDRSADSVAAWLGATPGIRVIARDRSDLYADGATRGAPDATQVADRFHLLKNLGDALERFLQQRRTRLKQASTPTVTPLPAPPLPSWQERIEREGEQRHAPWIARYEQVIALHAKGSGNRGHCPDGWN